MGVTYIDLMSTIDNYIEGLGVTVSIENGAYTSLIVSHYFGEKITETLYGRGNCQKAQQQHRLKVLAHFGIKLDEDKSEFPVVSHSILDDNEIPF